MVLGWLGWFSDIPSNPVKEIWTILLYLPGSISPIVYDNDQFTISYLRVFAPINNVNVADGKTSTKPDIETEHSDIEGASDDTEKYYNRDDSQDVRKTNNNESMAKIAN